MATEIEVRSTSYIPRPLQLELHRKLKRFNVLVLHRRFGKTVLSINHMVDRALRCKLPRPVFAYIAPTYSQAKRNVWSMLKQYTSTIPGVEYNEADMRAFIPSNGATIILLSAETPDSLRGMHLDGCIFDEFATMNPLVWSEVVRPALSDRRGWAIFISTPKGRNRFYELYDYAVNGRDGVKDPNWFGAIYKASETGIIAPDELEAARREMDEDSYEQEYECSFTAALSGAYFGKEMNLAATEGRIREVPHDPSIPVETAWDLGISDTTAIWFYQSVMGRHQFIDYYEMSGDSMPDIVRTIMKKPYKINAFVLPHDAQARDLSSGKTRVQTMYNLGCRNIRVIPKVGSKAESIQAARMILGKCYFDAVKCKQGIEALINYQKKWDDKNQIFQNNPLHNKYSNGADAFQQFALGCRDDSRDTGRNSFSRDYRGNLVAETDYNVFG